MERGGTEERSREETRNKKSKSEKESRTESRQREWGRPERKRTEVSRQMHSFHNILSQRACKQSYAAVVGHLALHQAGMIMTSSLHRHKIQPLITGLFTAQAAEL